MRTLAGLSTPAFSLPRPEGLLYSALAVAPIMLVTPLLQLYDSRDELKEQPAHRLSTKT